MNELLNEMLHGLAWVAKPFVDKAGLGGVLRQLYVETLRLGEHVRFAITGRPDPSMTIFLAGSGRSGTTWLASLLSAIPGVQQVFEPLQPVWNAEARCLAGWDHNWNKERSYFRAIYLRPHGHYPGWQDLLERILGGRLRNYLTDYERTSFFPKRFLIKEIRAGVYI